MNNIRNTFFASRARKFSAHGGVLLLAGFLFSGFLFSIPRDEAHACSQYGILPRLTATVTDVNNRSVSADTSNNVTFIPGDGTEDGPNEAYGTDTQTIAVPYGESVRILYAMEAESSSVNYTYYPYEGSLMRPGPPSVPITYTSQPIVSDVNFQINIVASCFHDPAHTKTAQLLIKIQPVSPERVAGTLQITDVLNPDNSPNTNTQPSSSTITVKGKGVGGKVIGQSCPSLGDPSRRSIQEKQLAQPTTYEIDGSPVAAYSLQVTASGKDNPLCGDSENESWEYGFTLSNIPVSALSGTNPHTISFYAQDLATNNQIRSTVSFYVNTSSAIGNFTLSMSPYQEMLENGATSFTLSANCTGGLTGPITKLKFAPGGNPFNTNVNFNFPTSIACGSNTGILVVTSTVGASPVSEPIAPFNTRQITIEGSSATKTQTAQGNLRIYALPRITSFQVSPSSTTVGSSANITWVSTHTVLCSASGDWSGSKLTSNSVGESTGVLTRTNPDYSYTLKCNGALGSSDQVTQSVVVSNVPSKIHVNYTVDGVLFETSNLTARYGISGPTAIPSAVHPIAGDHNGLEPGNYTFNFLTPPAGYTFNSVSPSTNTLGSGETRNFTINLKSVSTTCPTTPGTFTLNPVNVKAGDTANIIIPAGYVGGTIVSNNTGIATVSRSGSVFTLKAVKGGWVTLSGVGWNYGGVVCQPLPLSTHVEDFSVGIVPAFTQIKQGDSVSSIVIHIFGNEWTGSGVTVDMPEIKFYAPGNPKDGTPITLSGPAKFCRISNLSNCTVPMSMQQVTGQNAGLLSFVTTSSTSVGTYKIVAKGKFANGFTVTEESFLQVDSAGPGVLTPPSTVTASNAGTCGIITVTFTNWLDTAQIPPAPEGYRLYRSNTGPQDSPPQSYSWSQVTLITGGSPKVTKGDGSISYDWRFVEDQGPFAAGGHYYYAVTSYKSGAESIKTIASPARIPSPSSCNVPVPNLSGSDKQVIAVKGITNPPGASTSCGGKTEVIDVNGGKLNIGDIVRFKIEICNSGTADINPKNSDPLIVTDKFKNFKVPASGLKLKYNGGNCDASSGCKVDIASSDLTFTLTKGVLQQGGHVWTLTFDLQLGAPAGTTSDLVLAQNTGQITFGSLKQSFATPPYIVFLPNNNVPRQYEISP